jgi:hypothetical protein
MRDILRAESSMLVVELDTVRLVIFPVELVMISPAPEVTESTAWSKTLSASFTCAAVPLSSICISFSGDSSINMRD